jgi:hypothetical protein
VSRIVVVGGVAAGMSAASQGTGRLLGAAATVARKRLHAVRRREAAAVGRQAP